MNWLCSIIVFISVLCSSSWSFSLKFTHDLHPVHTLPGMFNSHVKPVVVRSYGFHRRFFGQASDVAIFAPGSASYLHYHSGLPFVTNADALVPFLHWPDGPYHTTNYGRIKLNHAARVFAILWAFRTFYYPLSANFTPSMKGLPPSWKIIGPVRSQSGVWDPLGDKDRWSQNGKGKRLQLPGVGLAVELPPVGHKNDLNLSIPHPWNISMDGEGVSRFALIFVPRQKNKKRIRLRSFPRPKTPKPFRRFLLDSTASESKDELFRPRLERPVSNQKCPDWLHDLYITRSHIPQRERAKNEPQYWRTWHPIVDPIYWCYFEHEHGSYPGLHYKPMFGYTAFKTRDKNNVHGRQIESHEGFKVISIPQKDHRLVVMTIHLHASQPRRFVVRRHTVILAVVGAEGKLEMEISMKSDFGPAKAGMARGPSEPFTYKDKVINTIINNRLRITAGRTFNVLNIDENFPNSVDRRYRFKGSISRGAGSMLGGFYEQWKTTINTCTWPRNDGAFQIDVRDPPTAARFVNKGDSKENIQYLAGIGTRRFLIINRPIILSAKYCFDGLRKRRKNGVFFTDSYMRRTYKRKGEYRVRQYVKKGFRDVVFDHTSIQAADPWDGIYFPGKSNVTGMHNIEQAIRREIN